MTEHTSSGVTWSLPSSHALARLAREFPSREAYRDFWREHPAFQEAADWNPELEAYFDYDLVGTEPHLKSCVAEDAVRADGLESGHLLPPIRSARALDVLVDAIVAAAKR